MSGRRTTEELAAAAAELVERTTRAQGLPLKISDPVALSRIATLMRSPLTSTPGTSSSLPLDEAVTGRRPADHPLGPPPPNPAPTATPAGPGRGSLPAA